MRATSCKNISDQARRWAGRNASDRKRSHRFVPRGRRTVAHGRAGRQQGGWASGISRNYIAKWTIGQARVDSSTTSSATGHPRTFNRARTRQRDTIYNHLHSRRRDNLLDSNPEKSAKKNRHHGCLASRGQLFGHDMSMLSLHPIHCYYCITCTTITPSHALILFRHMHCYYFLTCTAIASSHALILLHHMHCY